MAGAKLPHFAPQPPRMASGTKPSGQRRPRWLAATAGFSLVEILIALTLVTIVLGLGVSLVSDPYAKAQRAADANQLLDDLRTINDAATACAARGITLASNDLAPLVSNGCLKTLKTPPGGGSYQVADGRPGGAGTSHLAIQVPGLTARTCAKFNQLVRIDAIPAGLDNGGALTDPPAAKYVCYDKAGVYTVSSNLYPGSLPAPPPPQVSTCADAMLAMTPTGCSYWDNSLTVAENRDYSMTVVAAAHPELTCVSCHAL